MMRFLLARTVAGAAVALMTITIYLVVERAVAARLPLDVCLEQHLQWDASNAYGPGAFGGGWSMAGIGLLMDIPVALGWSFAYTAAALRWPALSRRPLLSGLAFGAIVMLTMHYAVVPLGHADRGADTPIALLNVLVAHTLFFGLPLALVIRPAREPA
jgi:uncharacterized membrane protein YagU involved in acid resistance